MRGYPYANISQRVPDRIPDPTPFSCSPVSGLRLDGESDGQGPAVVALHGLTATRRYVLQGSRMLARGGRRLVAYDARGHGRSFPAPDGSYVYADLVTDLEAVLDQLGIETCVLAGSSMGAATATAFALAHPGRVEAMVQITPAYAGSPYADPDALARWDARADALDAGDIDRFVTLTGADALPERLRDAARLAVRQRAERHTDLHAVAAATRSIPRSAAFESLDRLAELELPVLVVGSRDDADPQHPLALAREYASRLACAELAVENEGSPPLAWQGARLSHTIAAFLDRQS